MDTQEPYADADWNTLTVAVYTGDVGTVRTADIDWTDTFDYAAAEETGDIPTAADEAEQRAAVVAALAELGWEPVPGLEWCDLTGGLGFERGGVRIPVQPRPVMLDLETIRAALPEHVHVERVTGRDVVTGGDLVSVLLWADRPYNTCPRCKEPIKTDLAGEPPAILDAGAGQGGQMLPVSQQHGCGEWLFVDWQAFDDAPVTLEVLLDAARAMVRTRDEQIAAQVARIRKDLERMVFDAVTDLVKPLQDGETFADRVAEVSTGSEVEPGVYVDGSKVIAWDDYPIGETDPPLAAAATVNFFTVTLLLGKPRIGMPTQWETVYTNPVYTSTGAADDAARDVLAGHANFDVDKSMWKVIAWAGHHADPDETPAYIYDRRRRPVPPITMMRSPREVLELQAEIDAALGRVADEHGVVYDEVSANRVLQQAADMAIAAQLVLQWVAGGDRLGFDVLSLLVLNRFTPPPPRHDQGVAETGDGRAGEW